MCKIFSAKSFKNNSSIIMLSRQCIKCSSASTEFMKITRSKVYDYFTVNITYFPENSHFRLLSSMNPFNFEYLEDINAFLINAVNASVQRHLLSHNKSTYLITIFISMVQNIRSFNSF